MEEVGRGHFGCSLPVCSVPGTASEPAGLFAAAAGFADLLLQLLELADWPGQLHGQRGPHGLHWTAAQRQPGVAPEPAAKATAAVPAAGLSTGKEEGKEEGEDREIG